MPFKTLRYLLPLLFFISCSEDPSSDKPTEFIQLASVTVGTESLDLSNPLENTSIPFDKDILINFSSAIDVRTTNAISLSSPTGPIEFDLELINDNTTLSLTPDDPLPTNTLITLEISDELSGANGEVYPGIEIGFTTLQGSFTVQATNIDGQPGTTFRIQNVDRNPTIVVTFPIAVNPSTITNSTVRLPDGDGLPVLNLSLSEGNTKLTITTTAQLDHLERYSLSLLAGIQGANGEIFIPYSKYFYTEIDPTPKKPVISDEDLLTLVQEQTFKYFYDFAEPVSGMARERNTSGSLVTSGGAGFGIMALIVGMERDFITQQAGLDRMHKIVTFLEGADKFHGAWSHWINGTTGDVIPFSANDNGGDLVETAFLVEGLITFRQYLTTNSIADGHNLVNRINALWQAVEWDWYRRSNQNVLYWHWSPNLDWVMNHQIRGWNECLITYVLAASSPTHTINYDVYRLGWANNGGIRNGGMYEGITLPLGSAWGGPLFFTHYSFVGMSPKGEILNDGINLSDQYADYWTQNVNHSLINYRYCVRNPQQYVGYSDECWGLTASDNQSGYNAHSPTNDLGVITPTAALSSFPYTPTESMKALKFFYYTLGDRLWGQYGFYDSFNVTEDWYASSYLAIDQGPIIVMIENHRTGLLWNLFMSAPEVQSGLDKLDFTY